MSLSREAENEICDYIREHSATLFGQKFRECRYVTPIKVQTKSDKYETKFLAISKFRAFFLSGKQFSHLKIEKGFNVLALRHLNVITPNYGLNISWEERNGRNLSTLFIKTSDENEATKLACEFLSALKHYFPDIRPSLTKLLSISPPALVAAFAHLPFSTPDLPCNNFRRSYVTYCDYNDLLYKDEISWDIENIYFVHDIHEIRLEDFSHLPIRDQITVICCAQFSAYFTGISADSCRLSIEHVEAILSVIRRSHALKSLVLVNCGLPKDFFAQLATALQHNNTIPLEYLNLSNNNLDDKKGISQLASVLPRIYSLKSVLLNDCCLSDKSIHYLASGLYTGFSDFGNSIITSTAYSQQSQHTRFELNSLHLAGNSLKDDANELINFISLCNTLRVLNLSHTGFCLDRLWSALKLGGLRLESLKLAGCCAIPTSKKSGSDNINTTVKELFSSMVSLKELDFAGTPISAEILQNILIGIANNNCISNISLNLNGVLSASKGCASVLEQHIAMCSISHLSLRDNAIEHDATKILPSLLQMQSLKRLDLGGTNFHGLKISKKNSPTLSKVLQEISNLLSFPDSHIEELILSDCRLGSACMSVVFEPLASTRLKLLDVSGNELGNTGARFLSKAIQLNNTLHTLFLDRNQIGVEGFIELEHGLRLNHSICTLPFPLNDVAMIADRQRIISIFMKIDKHLECNSVNVELTKKCCQTAIQSLIIKCDNYNINACDENKIIFHNFLKSVAEMRKYNAINVNIDEIVSEILATTNIASLKNSNKFEQKFNDIIAERRIDLATHAGSIILQSKKDSDHLIEVLRKELKGALINYFTRAAWQNLVHKSDLLLSTPNSLKLCDGIQSNFTIDNSVHAAINAERTMGALGRRPNSIFHDSLVTSLTESLPQDEPSINDKPVTPLVHLAKNRPKPARQLRNRLNTPLKHSCGSIATDDSFDYVNSSISSLRKSRQSNGTDCNCQNTTSTDDADIQPSDSPQRHNNMTPPPLVPRRNKMSALSSSSNATPPKLPPKPSTGTDFSLGNNSIAGHNKHRVSPIKPDT